MKIVSVLTSKETGGAESSALALLEALAKRDHQTVSLTNQQQSSNYVLLKPIGLGPKLSSKSWLRLLLTAPYYYLKLWYRLSQEQPYDILLLHFKKEQILASYLPEKIRQKIIWAEWGPVPKQLQSGPQRLIFRHAASKAKFILAVSESTQNSLLKIGVNPEKVTFLPNFVDINRLFFRSDARKAIRKQLAIPEAAFVVGCISRFNRKKRNEVLIEAIKCLPEHFHLIMAGAGEAETELRRLAEPLGKRAHFLPTPGKRIAEILSAFDVTVFCPSPTEGAPLAIVYALLAERPVIATAPAGATELLQPEFGVITNPANDPATVARAIASYAADPERAHSEGQRGRARMLLTHNPSKLIDLLESKLYKAMLASA